MQRRPPRSIARLSALVLAGGLPAVLGEALSLRPGMVLGASTALWGSILIGLGVAAMGGAIARVARG